MKRTHVAAVLLLALFLRVGYLFFHPGQDYRANVVYQADSARYVELAGSILDGRGLAVGGVPSARTGPVYPLFLAAVFSVSGRSVVAVRAVQIALSVLTCLLVSLLARELGDRRAAGVALVFAALYWPFVQTPCYVLTETVFIFLLAAAFLLALRAVRTGRVRTFAAAGLAAGAALLTRPVAVALVPFAAALPSAAGPGRAARAGAVWAGCFLLLAVPWTIRNARVFGAFIPLSTEDGVTLYRGNNPEATGGTGGWSSAGIDTTAAFPAEVAGLDEVAASRELKRRAIAYVRENPGRFLRLSGRRFVNMWRPFYAGSDVRTRIITTAQECFVLYPLAVIGAVLCLRRGGAARRSAAALLLFAAAYTAVIVVGVGVVRYRYPLAPVLMVFAACAVSRAIARVSRTRPPAAG